MILLEGMNGERRGFAQVTEYLVTIRVEGSGDILVIPRVDAPQNMVCGVEPRLVCEISPPQIPVFLLALTLVRCLRSSYTNPFPHSMYGRDVCWDGIAIRPTLVGTWICRVCPQDQSDGEAS